jgi:2-C-methyl-D-erythritol 4-phosphate cytidylyltransferase
VPDLVETWAVVVAAGEGVRLAAGLPKAFARLGDRPLLARSIELFEDHPAVERVVLVVPAGWEEPASLLVDELAAGKVAAAVPGGATRVESVAAGLAEVPERAELVLVHDAARPLASSELVLRVLAALGDADGAVPALPIADTVKEVAGERVVRTLERASLRAVQTPQAFRAEALRAALAEAPAGGVTDCASLLERAGRAVAVVAGERRNFKVTDAEDLRAAEALL